LFKCEKINVCTHCSVVEANDPACIETLYSCSDLLSLNYSQLSLPACYSDFSIHLRRERGGRHVTALLIGGKKAKPTTTIAHPATVIAGVNIQIIWV
jgi:hypothetical protein